MNDLPAWFLEKVTLDEFGGSGCWLWTAGAGGGGYGKITLQGKAMYAHRFAYETLVGPIPDDLELDHLCRETRCVNPAHLEAVTHRENMLRGENVSAWAARKTHCVNGHEFTPENTGRLRSDPLRRICRKCDAVKQRRYQARRKERKGE